MTIQKGKYYYCIETVVMSGGVIKAYTKGKVYCSVKDKNLTDNQGCVQHSISDNFAEEHFIEIDKVIEAYTYTKRIMTNCNKKAV